ncbi:MAG: radical SAM protein [Acutalibacteraceae bacterium]|nr:radical SAM protein [Acutalibacteraceae bacterium]
MVEIAITIKPTLSCNMKCRHCFNGEKLNKSGVVDIEIVKNLLMKASQEYESVKVTFHGGEPTLAGMDFYREVFECQHEVSRREGTTFRNFFTTNGLLLDDKFIDLLIENNTLINVSFDGPYNDILRSNTDRVLENIKMIKEKNGRIRCFCTLSKDSVEHLDEIYDWFIENNLDFKTLPIEKVGYAKENKNLIMTPETLVASLTRTYRRWIKDKKCNVRYFTFEEFSSLRRDIQFKPYWFNRKLSLNPDGKIYPFGRPNDVNFCLGSPNDISRIEDCFTSEQYILLRQILKRFYDERCQKCMSLGVCNGVAICMTYMYEEDEDILSYSCTQSSLLFQSILSVNDEIIADFKAGRIDDYSDYIKNKFVDYVDIVS